MKTTSTKSDLNVRLKVAIIESRRSQGAIAKSAGIGEVRFSKIVTRRLPPTPTEMVRIAKALHRPTTELFAEAVSA